MTPSPAFARRVFGGSALIGLALLAPQYFLEARIGLDFPPAITHPEYFYGFVGLAVAWQIAFLLIASDPVRYRPFMLAGILEKATFGGAVWVLYLLDRAPAILLGFATFDLSLGALFVLAYLKTPRA